VEHLLGLEHQGRHIVRFVHRFATLEENRLRSAPDELLGTPDGQRWVIEDGTLNPPEQLLDGSGISQTSNELFGKLRSSCVLLLFDSGQCLAGGLEPLLDEAC
jgi:hypothetical protein